MPNDLDSFILGDPPGAASPGGGGDLDSFILGKPEVSASAPPPGPPDENLISRGVHVLGAAGRAVNTGLGKVAGIIGPSDRPFSEQYREAMAPSAPTEVTPLDWMAVVPAIIGTSGKVSPTLQKYEAAVAGPIAETAAAASTDPLTYGALGALSKLGKAGAALETFLGAAFSGQMGADAVVAGYQAWEEIKAKGLTPEAVEGAVQSLTAAGFTVLGGVGAARGGRALMEGRHAPPPEPASVYESAQKVNEAAKDPSKGFYETKKLAEDFGAAVEASLTDSPVRLDPRIRSAQETARDLPKLPKGQRTLGILDFLPEDAREPAWAYIKREVEDAEATGRDRHEMAKNAAAGLPEEHRAELEWQALTLYDNRVEGRAYLDGLKSGYDEFEDLSKRPEPEVRVDDKTGQKVEVYDYGNGNRHYLWRDPATGQVGAGAEASNGYIAYIVGGERVMGLPKEGIGPVYRALKADGIESSPVLLPAGAAAQRRAAEKGLDVRGGPYEILSQEVRSGLGAEKPGTVGEAAAVPGERPEVVPGEPQVQAAAAREPAPEAGGPPGGALPGGALRPEQPGVQLGAAPPAEPGAAPFPGGPGRGREPIPAWGTAPAADSVTGVHTTPGEIPRASAPSTSGNLAIKPRPEEMPPPPPPPGSPPGAPSPYDPLDLTDPILKQTYHKQVVQAVTDAMTAAGIPWNQRRYPVLSDQVASMVKDGTLPLPALVENLKTRGLSIVNFMDELWRPAVTDGARRLAELSHLSRQLSKLAKEQGAKPEVLDTMNQGLAEISQQLDGMALARGWWRRLENIRRGLLVTQLSTTMRNVETQIVRTGVGALTDSLDYALQRGLKAAGLNIQPSVHPLDGFYIVGRAANALATLGRGKGARRLKSLSGQLLGKEEGGKFIDGLFDKKHHDRLFNVFASDIGALSRERGVVLKGADRVFGKVESAVNWLNTLNRGQEFIFRNAVLVSRLDSELGARNLGDLATNIKEHNLALKEYEKANPNWRQDPKLVEMFQKDPRNIYTKIDEGMLNRSIDSALEMTFAENPKYGTVGYEVLRAVNRIPGMTLVLPFPRFMLNSLKFLWQYNPTGFLNLLTKGEREKIARGDTSTISKAMVGSAMLLAAYQVRSSEDAGERWYEVNVGSGKTKRTIDIRPFNPFAGHFFIADVIKRWRENRLYQLTPQDTISGLLSTNLRAGTGLALMDQVFAQATSLGSPQEIKKQFDRFAGEYFSGFLTPLQVVADTYAQFDADARVVRDRRQAKGVADILKTRLPGGSKDLPPLELPTREGPAINEFPLLKQVTGLLIADPKNPLESELQRLQFAPNEIFRGTKSPEADALVKHYMGQFAEEMGVDLVLSKDYQELPDDEKGLLLAEVLGEARKAARATAVAENPELFVDLRRMSVRQRLFEQAEEVRTEAETSGKEEAGPPGPPEEEPDEDEDQ